MIEVDEFDEDTTTDPEADSLEDLQSRTLYRRPVLLDDTDPVEDPDLPGAVLAEEPIEVAIVPQQPDEFMCTSCFLIQHQRLIAVGETTVCRDCA